MQKHTTHVHRPAFLTKTILFPFFYELLEACLHQTIHFSCLNLSHMNQSLNYVILGYGSNMVCVIPYIFY